MALIAAVIPGAILAVRFIFPNF